MSRPPLYSLNRSQESNPYLQRRRHMMAEINVTPFVDVMLVLLVIFMITAPLMQQGVDVQLPKASTAAQPILDIPTITLANNKRIYWNKDELSTLVELNTRLNDYAEQSKDPSVNFRADKALDYGFVMKVLATIKRSGVERIGMVTEPDAL